MKISDVKWAGELYLRAVVQGEVEIYHFHGSDFGPHKQGTYALFPAGWRVGGDYWMNLSEIEAQAVLYRLLKE